jgi:hypothetical protein
VRNFGRESDSVRSICYTFVAGISNSTAVMTFSDMKRDTDYSTEIYQAVRFLVQ